MQIVRNWARAPRIFGNSITGPVFVLSFVRARSHTDTHTHTHTDTHTRLRGSTPARNIPCVYPEDRAKSKEILWFAETMSKVYSTSRSTSRNSGSVDCRVLRVCQNQRCRNTSKYLANLGKVFIRIPFIFLNYVHKNIKTHEYPQSIRGNFTTTMGPTLICIFFSTTSKLRNWKLQNSLSFVSFFLTSQV